MPIYKDERLTEWKEKGYMTFMYYPDFKGYREDLIDFKNRQLSTFLYFLGPRPGELTTFKRSDIWYKNGRLTFRVSTLKRKGDKRTRLIDWNMSKYPELKEFWEWVKPMPQGFYVFSWLVGHSNPRMYIKQQLGVSAYFFRHNINSLLSASGASTKQRMLFKGAQDSRSIEDYDHMSKKERDDTTNRLDLAVSGE